MGCDWLTKLSKKIGKTLGMNEAVFAMAEKGKPISPSLKKVSQIMPVILLNHLSEAELHDIQNHQIPLMVSTGGKLAMGDFALLIGNGAASDTDGDDSISGVTVLYDNQLYDSDLNTISEDVDDYFAPPSVTAPPTNGAAVAVKPMTPAPIPSTTTPAPSAPPAKSKPVEPPPDPMKFIDAESIKSMQFNAKVKYSLGFLSPQTLVEQMMPFLMGEKENKYLSSPLTVFQRQDGDWEIRPTWVSGMRLKSEKQAKQVQSFLAKKYKELLTEVATGVARKENLIGIVAKFDYGVSAIHSQGKDYVRLKLSEEENLLLDAEWAGEYFKWEKKQHGNQYVADKVAQNMVRGLAQPIIRSVVNAHNSALNFKRYQKVVAKVLVESEGVTAEKDPRSYIVAQTGKSIIEKMDANKSSRLYQTTSDYTRPAIWAFYGWVRAVKANKKKLVPVMKAMAQASASGGSSMLGETYVKQFNALMPPLPATPQKTSLPDELPSFWSDFVIQSGGDWKKFIEELQATHSDLKKRI